MQRLVDPITRVYIFFREDNRDPFTFAGMGTPVGIADTTPVHVRWQLSGVSAPSLLTIPEEILGTATVIEGARRTISVNVYERNPNARRKCIERWGVVCYVCGFDFKQVYGALGEGFIHVHHLKPLGEIGEAYELDPLEDLRPVCPNCHAMLHRRDPALGIDELNKIISKG
jgi:5-methylcytosine-specific restriction protein A